MIEQILTSLSDALAGNAALALGAALVWGVLSVALSPCHLTSIPAIVGFLNGSAVNSRRAFGLSSLFAFGTLVSIAPTSAITAAMGRLMGDLGTLGTVLVAVVFFVFGLHLLGVIGMPDFLQPDPNQAKRGALGAFTYGFIFGVALGPCTFGFMAPVLSLALGSAAKAPGYALLLLTLFGIGHCLVLAVAGVSGNALERLIPPSKARPLRRACGLLLLVGGIYFVATAL